MVTENINIDVRPGGVPVVIHVTQYEVGLRQFIFTPYTSNGTQTVVAGSATLEGTKPDGYAFQQACEMVDGVITYTLQEQLCAVEGRVWSRLVIRDTDGGMIGYTAIVWVVGCAGVKDDAVMSDSDISALRQFLDEFGDIDAYRGALNGALAAVGGPLVASTAAAMTDRTKVYVYTGSESGYTEGHWYYWSGSAWTDGGVYQATGINTDKTLTVEDMAADAKAAGDAVAELKNDLRSALISTEKLYGFAEYHCNSGNAHSSANDRVSGINILTGTTFAIKFYKTTANNITYQVFAKYNDNTSEMVAVISNAKKYAVTDILIASKDIVSLGVYNTAPSSDEDILFTVVEGDYQAYKTNTKNLYNNTNIIGSNSFVLSQNIAHSSSNDNISNIQIPVGEAFTVEVSTLLDTDMTFSISLKYSDSTNEEIRGFVAKDRYCIYTGYAKKDISGIGLYIAAQSANTVSFVAYYGHKFKSDLYYQIAGSSRFTVSSGFSHSSTNDRVNDIKISSGEQYALIIKQQRNARIEVRAENDGGTPVAVTNDNESYIILTAQANIGYIGLYVASSTESNNVMVEVITNYETIEEVKTLSAVLENEKHALIMDEYTFFNMNSGSGHSSTADRLLVPISQGSEFAVLVDTGINVSCELWVRYVGAESSTRIDSFTNFDKSIHFYIAENSVESLGLFVAAPDQNIKVHFGVIKNEKTIELSKTLAKSGENVNDLKIQNYDYDTKISMYTDLFKDAGNSDAFVYFTDPHLLGVSGTFDYNKFYTYTGIISEFFYKTATQFVLCGGDWLNDSDTPTQALKKLNTMTTRMKELLGDRYFPMFGNHDSNYQGTTALTQAAINNVMFPYQGNSYYHFLSTHARYYVLDSGLDWYNEMDTRKWEQVNWLGNKLKTYDDVHSVICMHIIWRVHPETDTDPVDPFCDNIDKLIDAYNNHTTVTLNTVTYDFSGCTGNVAFIIGGHNHMDITNETICSVPVITRANTNNGNQITFDLMLADWDNRKLQIVRIGSGASSTAEVVEF